jgi:vancomycin resistance protein YoaR
VLDGWQAETDNGEQEGALRLTGTRVTPVDPHAGSGMVRSRAQAALVAALGRPQRGIVDVPEGALRPRLDSRAVDAAAARARRLLAGDVTLVVGPTPVRVTPKQLASAMGTRIVGHDLEVTLDANRLHAAIGAPLAALEQLPVDAQFEVTAENTVNVVPSHNGHEVDMNVVVAAFLAGRRRVVAPVKVVTPRRNTAWARKLGIDREVSSFTTDYPPGETRVVNIHRGADLLNNTVVEPGQVFSLNQTVGPRTAARGFVTAPVFAQGEFFDDYGGGVSQLATTTYNAAFFGGYADVTHQPHTIYISRYPPGREATVNYGVIDLEFRDDTRHGILIRAYYSATSVTVTLYGDTDGRTAHEENRSTSNPVPIADQRILCPASTIVDPNDVCATLAPGQTEQVSTGDSGFDVAFDRVIDYPDRAARREHYTWHYTMLPNQILVGTDNPARSTTSTATSATP